MKRIVQFALIILVSAMEDASSFLLGQKSRSSMLRRSQYPSSFPSSFPAPLPSQSARPTTKTSLSMMGWEDIVFSADSLASQLATTSLTSDTPVTLASFPLLYAAGLLTSVSPCVWGLLPLTISYISTAAGERDDKAAVLPTLAFAAGLASVFCTLGLLAASVGGVFGQAETMGPAKIIVPLLSSGICLVMGFQLLELLNLPLPNLELDILKDVDNDEQEFSEIMFDDDGNMVVPASTPSSSSPKGSLFRTFLLGGSSALVASPCATPVLTSILAFVAGSQDPLLGAVLLLCYTLGYSTPLLLVAATGGQALAQLQGANQQDGWYGTIAPWVTPFTGGILLWYGTDSLLRAVFGDPTMAKLPMLGMS